MNQNFTQFAFSESARALQEHYGSRKNYARMEESGDRFLLTSQETAYIETRDSFYMASVGENGWPYVQFRGGPKGFLKVLGDRSIGFADFKGNRQYISAANIKDQGKVSLILMDYARRERLKIWAEAEMHFAVDVPDLAERLTVPNYKAKIERVFVMQIKAFDWNCRQHITPRFTEEEIRANIDQFLDTGGPETCENCD